MSASPADVYPKRNFGEDCLIKKIDTGLQAQKMLQIEIGFIIFCLKNSIPIQLEGPFFQIQSSLWQITTVNLQEAFKGTFKGILGP